MDWVRSQRGISYALAMWGLLIGGFLGTTARLSASDYAAPSGPHLKPHTTRPAEAPSPKTPPADTRLPVRADAADSASLRKNTDGRFVVFLVPGTYSNAEDWFLRVPGHATFASELCRALGPDTQWHSEVWASALDHKTRCKVAENLAAHIDEATTDDDRVVLVGHSHGGNIALLATAKVKRPVFAAVCLGTPHVYLKMAQSDRNDRNRTYALPVYCPPETLRNARHIVTMTARHDAVPSRWADLRRGLDENDALHATRGWQTRLSSLSLPDDGDPCRELWACFTGTKMVDHLFTTGGLNVASDNIVFPSFVPDNLGRGAHQSVHSRRMGYVLGTALKQNFDEPSRAALRTLTQWPDSDSGQKMPLAEFQKWERRKQPDFDHVGWLLTEVHLDASSDIDRQKYWLSSDPDPYFILSADRPARTIFRAETRRDTKQARWTVENCFVHKSDRAEFAVYEANTLGHVLLGSEKLPAKSGSLPTQLKGPGWSARLTWQSLHE